MLLLTVQSINDMIFLIAETMRRPCVAQGFVPVLLKFLKSDDVSLATQACRALGNICFENGELKQKSKMTSSTF